jgi:hypothetical protein
MDDQKKIHAWISHFAQSINGITPNDQHLLILDGHGSHVTLQVIHQAQVLGLDMLTLLVHTKHALQPLNVNCFKPFKLAFKKYPRCLAVSKQPQICREGGPCPMCFFSMEMSSYS